MILDEINKANVQAIKDKDQVARNIYSVVKNKALMEVVRKRTAGGGDLTDADMVAILQKTIKELTEEGENYRRVNNTVELENIKKQKALLEGYLPKMMSEDEIKTEIMKLDDKSIPTVMRHFKANFAGKCDMRTVQEVLKKL